MRLKRRVFLGAITSAMLVCSAAATEDNETLTSNCVIDENKYYFIDLYDLPAVSSFFGLIPERYFSKNMAFSGLIGERNKISKYYDNPSRDLLAQNVELINTVYLDEPEYRADGDTVTLVSKDSTQLYGTKKYKRKINKFEKHELVGKIKRKERPDFISRLNNYLSTQVDSISVKLETRHSELSLLYLHYGEITASTTLEQINIVNYGMLKTIVIFKLEFNKKNLETLNFNERKYLSRVFCDISGEFEEKFPSALQLRNFGYKELNELANKSFPIRTFFQNNPVYFSIGQIVVLTLIGGLFLYLVFNRYYKAPIIRYSTLKQNSKEK